MEPFALEDISYWHWLAFGVLLMLVEILVPGVVFLWLGIAGVLTGLLLAAVSDMGWQVQLVVFAVLSVASIFLGRRFVASRQRPTDHPTLNRRGRSMVGTRATLRDATVNGRGRVRIGDTMWALRLAAPGVELPADTEVEVVEVDGVTLVAREIAAEPVDEAAGGPSPEPADDEPEAPEWRPRRRIPPSRLRGR